MKTKLLFAFGMHGSDRRGYSAPPDKPFFKNSVVPFLEEHVERGGKKATIIREVSIMWDVSDLICSKDEEHLRDLAIIRFMAKTAGHREAARGYEEILSLLRTVCKRCEAKIAEDHQMFDKGTDVPDVKHWGFEEYVLQINKRSPGTIRSVGERLDAKAVVAEIAHFHDFGSLVRSFENKPELDEVELFVEEVKTCADAVRRRDRCVIEQIDEIAAADPGGVIVVVRGIGHKPMAKMIDESRFEAIVKQRVDPSEFAEKILVLPEGYIARLEWSMGEMDRERLREMIVRQATQQLMIKDRYYAGEIDEAGVRRYAEDWRGRREELNRKYLRGKKPSG